MDEIDLTDVLRRVLAASDGSWRSQPGRLEAAMRRELGPDARTHRARTHLLVVAAEERVPMRLATAGAGVDVRSDLVDLLCRSRGWTDEAARWTVATWAAALAGGGAASGPMPAWSDPGPRRDAPPDAGPFGVPAAQPAAPTAAAPLVTPTAAPAAAPAFAPPTELPTPAAVPASPPLQPPGQLPPPGQPSPPPAGLPRGSAKAAKRASAFLGAPVDVAYVAKGADPRWLFTAVLPVIGFMVVGGVIGSALLVVSSLLAIAYQQGTPTYVVALAGSRVVALRSSSGARPRSITFDGDRRMVERVAGGTFRSMRVADTQIWFLGGQGKAAERIPVDAGGLG